MNKIHKHGLGLIIVLLFYGSVYAQEQIPLVDALNTVEARFGRTFNYDPALVEGKFIAPLDPEADLSQTLEDLRQATQLSIEILDASTISIFERPKDLLGVCGVVKDKDTMQPLAFATVQAGGKAVITDEDGYFSLSGLSGETLVTISYLGYKTINRPQKYFPATCEPIYMLVSQQSLSEVVLKQFLVKGVDKLSSGKYRIDFDRFSTLPGLIEADVLQAVQAFPGIQSVNETVSNINIRGGTHDQNLIMWDDIKMYQSGHFFGLISVFNPQMNKEVLLTQNGTPVDKTDGVSGTIEMRSAGQVNPRFTANAGLNLINADLFVDLPVTQNSSLQVAGRKSMNDFFSTPTYDAYFDRITQNTEITQQQENTVNTNQDFDFYDASLRYLHRITDKDRIRANFILINNKLVFTENTVLASSVESRESQVTQNSVAAGLQYVRDWSTEFQTEVQVYNTDYKLEAINANIEDAQRFLQENSVSETGAKALANWQFSETLGFTGGYQFLETKVRNLDDVDNPRFVELEGRVVRVHSGFSSVKLNDQNSNWSGRVGVRYNYIPKFQKHLVEPRIRIGYEFDPYLSAEILGEMKHQVTTQVINFQDDFLGVEKRRWQLANDSLVPVLQSRQASLGLSYDRESFLASVTGYYKEVEGITTQSQGFLNQYEFVQQAGDYAAYGLDVLLRQNLWRLQIWASYSYMDNQYDFPTLLPDQFPSNFDITHATTLGIAYDHKGFKASVGANWRTGKPYTRPIEGQTIIGDDIQYGFPNQSRIEDFFRVDASASYRFKTGNMRFQFAASVWNLTDNENELNRFFNIEGNEIAQAKQSSLGLVPNVAVRVFF